jgi:hypothetical protein
MVQYTFKGSNRYFNNREEAVKMARFCGLKESDVKEVLFR